MSNIRHDIGVLLRTIWIKTPDKLHQIEYVETDMSLRKVSIRVTIALAILAMLIWMQGWWNAARPGGPFFGGDMSHFTYPRAMATMLSCCACVGWIIDYCDGSPIHWRATLPQVQVHLARSVRATVSGVR